jgi:hypothetical protein
MVYLEMVNGLIHQCIFAYVLQQRLIKTNDDGSVLFIVMRENYELDRGYFWAL